MAGDPTGKYTRHMSTLINAPVLEFLPIPIEIARKARRTRKDEFGHDLTVQMTAAPCRVCLRISKEPEDLILMSYQPLPDRNPYAEIGPIFIHAHECEPYSSTDAFPEDFLARELVVRAYDADGRILDATVAASGHGTNVAAAFLSDPRVDEVHVRHTSYTCFDFKIKRMMRSENG